MENLLIIDRQPLLRLGLKLLIGSHLPALRLLEASCRYSLPDLLSRKSISIIMLGFDPDLEDVESADIVRIRNQFPKSKLVIYAGSLPKKQIQPFFDLGISAYLSKQASVDEIVKCLQATMQNRMPNGTETGLANAKLFPEVKPGNHFILN